VTNRSEQGTKRNKWREIIAAYKLSGMSKPAYCDKEGLSTQQFSYYYARLKEEDKTFSNAPLLFAPVEITQKNNVSTDIIQIIFPNGMQCKFSCYLDASLIKNILGAVSSC
jgi:hypothetical protein